MYAEYGYCNVLHVLISYDISCSARWLQPTPTPQTPPMVSIHFYFWHQHRNQNVYQDYPSILKLFAYNLPSFPCFHLKKRETLDEEGKKSAWEKRKPSPLSCLLLSSTSIIFVPRDKSSSIHRQEMEQWRTQETAYIHACRRQTKRISCFVEPKLPFTSIYIMIILFSLLKY